MNNNKGWDVILRPRIRDWWKAQINGQTRVNLPKLAREAETVFRDDPQFREGFLEAFLYPVIYDYGITLLSEMRSVMGGSAEWEDDRSPWLEYNPDAHCHMSVLTMTPEQAAAAAAYREANIATEVKRIAMLKEIANGADPKSIVPPTTALRDRVRGTVLKVQKDEPSDDWYGQDVRESAKYCDNCTNLFEFKEYRNDPTTHDPKLCGTCRNATPEQLKHRKDTYGLDLPEDPDEWTEEQHEDFNNARVNDSPSERRDDDAREKCRVAANRRLKVGDLVRCGSLGAGAVILNDDGFITFVSDRRDSPPIVECTDPRLEIESIRVMCKRCGDGFYRPSDDEWGFDAPTAGICGVCARHYPHALLKAALDHYTYSLKLRTGEVVEFETCDFHGDWVHLEQFHNHSGWSGSTPPTEQFNGCDRGVDVRLSDIVWCYDHPS